MNTGLLVIYNRVIIMQTCGTHFNIRTSANWS